MSDIQNNLFSVKTWGGIILLIFLYQIIKMLAGFYHVDMDEYTLYIYFYIFLVLAYLFMPTRIPEV